MAQNKTAKEQLGVELEEPNTPQVVETPKVELETPERPGWLPEKFKDEGEFASSYKTLEDELRRRAEEQKRLEGQIQNLTQAIEQFDNKPTPSTTGADPQLREQLMAAYENDPVGTMAYMAQQIADQRLEEKLRTLQEQNDPQVKVQQEAQNQLLANAIDHEMANRYGDWNEFRDKVGSEIEHDPTLIPDGSLATLDSAVRTINRIYENVKARDILQQAESGNFVADQMKRQAQTLTGGTVRNGSADPNEEKIAQLKAAVNGMSYSAWRG